MYKWYIYYNVLVLRKRTRRNEKMKYQVKSVGGNLGIKDKPILETENRTEAFQMLGLARSLRYEEHYNRI